MGNQHNALSANPCLLHSFFTVYSTLGLHCLEQRIWIFSTVKSHSIGICVWYFVCSRHNVPAQHLIKGPSIKSVQEALILKALKTLLSTACTKAAAARGAAPTYWAKAQAEGCDYSFQAMHTSPGWDLPAFAYGFVYAHGQSSPVLQRGCKSRSQPRKDPTMRFTMRTLMRTARPSHNFITPNTPVYNILGCTGPLLQGILWERGIVTHNYSTQHYYFPILNVHCTSNHFPGCSK